MRNFLITLGLVLLVWAGAHVAVMTIPKDSYGYAFAIRQIAEFILSIEQWFKDNITEPIQYLLIIVGIFVTGHGILVGNGTVALIGINIAIIGIAWHYAVGIYDFAYHLTGNPVAAVLAVVAAAWVGGNIVKWFLLGSMKKN